MGSCGAEVFRAGERIQSCADQKEASGNRQAQQSMTLSQEQWLRPEGSSCLLHVQAVGMWAG